MPVTGPARYRFPRRVFARAHGREAMGRCGTPTHEEDEMTVTGIISAIIVGLIIGALGRLVVPGPQSIPIWLTIVVGIVAALIGTAIARAAGWANTDGIDWIEIVIQVLLAAVGVALVAGMRGRRTLS
jgi:uncharacterized membrane protein YeaQ/YmgE (transglycosylase-associated protein family)